MNPDSLWRAPPLAKNRGRTTVFGMINRSASPRCTAFNKVASATDPRGKLTTYTAQGNPLTVTAPADAAGVQPQTTYAYTGFTPTGYPPSSTVNRVSY